MDYSQEYFTIESLESGNTITLTIGSSVTTSDVAWIAWSKDKTNWTTINNVNDQTVTITVNADIENVYFKGSGTNLANNYESSGNQYITKFSSTKNYSISGNIMSLLYSDSFSDKTSVSGTYTFCGLFYQSAKLVDAQNLVIPITNIDKETMFCGMFNGCTGLVNPPMFSPEIVSGLRACMRMFYNCSSLLSTTNFDNFTTISGNNIMYDMFHNCSSLVNVPKIFKPTEVRQYSYGSMFAGCTSLTKAPILPASTLANYCYYNMFNGCTNLQEVTCLATDISATSCLTNWLNNVSAIGTFYKNSNMTLFTSGADGIPTNWMVKTANTLFFNEHYVENIIVVTDGIEHIVNTLSVSHNGNENIVWDIDNLKNYSLDYFTIESLEDDNTITFKQGSTTHEMYYSTDNGKNWYSSTSNINITLQTSEKVMFSCYDLQAFGTAYGQESSASQFYSSKNSNIYGNIMSLLYGDQFVGKYTFPANKNYWFGNMFKGFSKLINAGNLILPILNFGTNNYCYSCMFMNCTSLVSMPELPATTLSQYCYDNFVSGCSSLTTPNTELPATTLSQYCYSGMYYNCPQLTKTPFMKFTTTNGRQYTCFWMFYGCTALNEVTCLATTISGTRGFEDWLYGVAATGTFTKNVDMSSWPTGSSGIPSGWTVQNYTV